MALRWQAQREDAAVAEACSRTIAQFENIADVQFIFEI